MFKNCTCTVKVKDILEEYYLIALISHMMRAMVIDKYCMQV